VARPAAPRCRWCHRSTWAPSGWCGVCAGPQQLVGASIAFGVPSGLPSPALAPLRTSHVDPATAASVGISRPIRMPDGLAQDDDELNRLLEQVAGAIRDGRARVLVDGRSVRIEVSDTGITLRTDDT